MKSGVMKSVEVKSGLMNNFYQWADLLKEHPKHMRQDELNFLPAALEIVETPPSPIGRAITWSIVFLFLIALLWAFFGKIDIVAVAPGKIIPSDRIKTIQPLEASVVSQIHVKEGEEVKQGDKLVTLDTTQTEADQTRLRNEWLEATLQRARMSAMNKLMNAYHVANKREIDLNHLESYLALPENLPLDKATTQKQLLTEQFQEYRAKHRGVEIEKDRRVAEKQVIQSEIQKLTMTLPLITERTKSLQDLMEKGLGARDQYLTLEQQRIETEQSLVTQKAKIHELDAAIAGADEQISSLKAETYKTNMLEQQRAEQTIVAAEQELIKANTRNQQRLLTAPIDGTVQQLAIHTVGGVVTEAQALMNIVPKESVLEVEAMIQNKDIGFVEEGQIAEIKIDTFNFTQYGVIDGEVININNDAINDEKLGLVFLSRVKLNRSDIQVGKRLVNLSPGMAVTVEVKTGTRRIIEFFLAPLLRYGNESIRER